MNDGMNDAWDDHAAQHVNVKPGRDIFSLGMSLLFLNIYEQHDQQFRKPCIHN